MIEIESRELADIPVLHAYPVGQKDTPLPCATTAAGFRWTCIKKKAFLQPRSS